MKGKYMQTTTKVVHKEDCTRVFKKYDVSCPRCQELIKGAEPRAGWSRPEQTYHFRTCNHNNTNPGGYCMTPGCGAGGDFS